jgi:hypothetical protein
MQSGFSKQFKHALLVTAIIGGLSSNLNAEVILGNDLNSSQGSNETINALYSANRGSNGGGDQSLQFGDVLYGTAEDDVIIGGLGIDILWGKDGDDILIGGTEDFNPLNRDRAFGGEGKDIFIWAPGDGNDYFDGGNDIDVLVLGLIGENKDAEGKEEGAPFFAVSSSADFDGIYLDENNYPVVDIANGPGFCEIVEKDEANSEALASLKLDHLVRFVLRGKRAAFLESLDTDTPLADDGLRIAMHINNVEYLVCGGTEAGTAKVYDLSSVPAVEVDFSQLPLKAQTLVGDSFMTPSRL